MQKFIRITSLVAAGLMLLSLLALLVVFPLQRPLARLLNYPHEIISYLPMFPLVSVIFCALRLACIAPLALTDSKKGSIVLEIILLVCMAVVIPALSTVVSVVQPMVLSTVGSRMGSMYIAAKSVANMINNYCTIFVGLGQAIFYIVCGMRIASKWMNRKAEQEITASRNDVEE